VIASELKLPHYRRGYMGTADLLWRDNTGLVHCTDLKSRKADSACYDSDFIQGDGYATAIVETLGHAVDVVDVLLARENGTFLLEESPYASGIFLDVLSLYETLKGVR
jgi:hypothetical protein